MRQGWLLAVSALLLLILPGASADWPSAQGGPDGLAAESTEGFFSFPAYQEVSNSSLNSSYIPLVGDLDGDSASEIVFQQDSRIVVTDSRLKVLAERDIGETKSQHTLVRASGESYDAALLANYDNHTALVILTLADDSLRTLKNITLQANLSAGGLSCVSDPAPLCLFGASSSRVFVVDLEEDTARSDEMPGIHFSATSGPSIGDLHGNDSLQAVFWIDEDGDSDFGVAAYDLTHGGLDSRFGVQDDIYDGFHSNSEPLGRPVLLDLDNDSRLEVALSVFYDDHKNVFTGITTDWFTEIILLDNLGQQLFSHCSENDVLNNGCNDGGSVTRRWRGTNPFPLDGDSDGQEDICVIQDWKEGGYSFNMSLRCFNRSGSIVHEARLGGDPPGLVSYEFTSASAMDVDDDGQREILSDQGIFETDGSLLLDLDRYGSSVIPARRDNYQANILVSDTRGATLFFPEHDACPGSVQVSAISGDGSPVANVSVVSEGESRGMTDDLGLLEIDDVKACGKRLAFTAICAQNNETCGLKSTSLDLLNDSDTLGFDCSVCSGYRDISIASEDVSFDISTGNVTLNITAVNLIPAEDINLTVMTAKGGVTEKQASLLFNITENMTSVRLSLQMPLESAERIHITLDATGRLEEPKRNNYLSVPLIAEKPRALLLIDTGNRAADAAISSYLQSFVRPVEEDKLGERTVTLIVGRNHPEFQTANNHMIDHVDGGVGYRDSLVFYKQDALGLEPYVGLVTGFWHPWSTKNYVVAFGNDLEGDLAAVKTLLGAKDTFLDPELYTFERTRIIEPLDSTGIRTYDYLHSRENEPHFGEESSAFREIVDNLLAGETYESHIQTVKTSSGTSYGQPSVLRFKHLNPSLSSYYEEFATNSTKPVVMSGGIFSNLETFEDGLGRELAQEGHDVWLIEMNGGPQIECADCPDYTYDDLAGHFWPALIAGIMHDSSSTEVNYVGHSNGCRAALSSLDLYSQEGKDSAGFLLDSSTGQYSLEVDLPARPVDKFFGIGCPATLNGESFSKNALTKTRLNAQITNGEYALNELNTSKHVSKKLLTSKLSIVLPFFIINDGFISFNLMNHYNSLYHNDSSIFEINDVRISKSYLFSGTKPTSFNPLPEEDDGAVPLEDINLINETLGETSEGVFTFFDTHSGLISNTEVKKIIRRKLR